MHSHEHHLADTYIQFSNFISYSNEELLTNVVGNCWISCLHLSVAFYVQKQLLLSVRYSHRSSVCPSVYPSVHHMGGPVKNGAS